MKCSSKLLRKVIKGIVNAKLTWKHRRLADTLVKNITFTDFTEKQQVAVIDTSLIIMEQHPNWAFPSICKEACREIDTLGP